MSSAKELFVAASKLTPDEQAAYLREACGGDAVLRAEVEDLLRRDREPGLLDEVDMEGLRDGLAHSSSALPSHVGPFRILGVLGHGGMGVVYRAEQSEPRREVALKVLAPGLGTPSARVRFAMEAEALGRLQHPGIAQILAAQIDRVDEGNPPYLAMELVRGEVLRDWANRVQPALDEKLRVIAEIAAAVHHAHQRGVIHRDLKPGNVMIDTDGRARVLDFGIARLFDDGAESSRTLPGMLLGTPAYMSPEQAAGDRSAIDVRSDVYSLAVVGYELLASRLPIDVAGDTVTGALRRVCDEDPVPLGDVDRRLRGDLQTVFACALRKEPDRRYESMAAFADDLRRVLHREPIRARPATASYLCLRFVQRHAWAVTAAAALLLGLVVALVVSMRATDRVEIARKDAERREAEARRAEQLQSDMLEVLGEVFGSSDPSENPETMHQTMAARLAASMARLESRFRDSPETECAVRRLLAKTLYGRGEYAAAAAQYVRVRDLLSAADDAANVDVACMLARSLWRSTDFDGALRALDAIATRMVEAPGVVIAEVAFLRGQILDKLGRPREAVDLWKDALARCQADPDLASSPLVASLHMSLGAAALAEGRLDEADAEIAAAASLIGSASGPDAEEALTLMNTQAVLLMGKGDFERAAKMMDEIVASWSRVFGADHPQLLGILQNQAATKVRIGMTDEAVQAFERAIAFGEQIHGKESAELATPLANLGTVRWKQGKLDEAAALYERAIDLREKHQPTPDKVLSGFYYDLARIRRDQGHASKYLALFQRSVEVRIAALGPYHPLVLTRRVELADVLGQQGRRGDAIAELRAIDGKLVEVLGKGHGASIASARLLATLLLAEGKPEEVPTWTAAMRERAAGTRDAAAVAANADALEEQARSRGR